MSEASEKARRSADTAYATALNESAMELQRKLAEFRSNMAARGLVQSGTMMAGTARLYAEHVRALLQARLDGLLDGYELHDVVLDDGLVEDTVKDILDLKANLLDSVRRSVKPVDTGLIPAGMFDRQVEVECGVAGAWVKAQIDKRKLAAKRKAQHITANIYHVHGHNPRWNVNSVDSSVNVVTVSPTRVFADLRQAIQMSVPEGEEQRDILVRLSALEQSQQSPTFAQRYTEFISAAANHMTLIAPFIPALTELLHKVLS